MIHDPIALHFKTVSVKGDEIDELLHHTAKHLSRKGERSVVFRLETLDHAIVPVTHDLGKHERIVLNLHRKGELERSVAMIRLTKDLSFHLKEIKMGDLKYYRLHTSAVMDVQS